MVMTDRRPAIEQQGSLSVIEQHLGINWQKRVHGYLLNNGYTPETLPKFNNNPKPHEYPDGRVTSAINLIEVDVGDDIEIVSFIPPDRKSSDHFHYTEEIYTVLEGEATIQGHGTYQQGGTITIQPETPHQVSTGESYVLLHIVMKGAALIPSHQRHLNLRKLYNKDVAMGRALDEGFPAANLDPAA